MNFTGGKNFVAVLCNLAIYFACIAHDQYQIHSYVLCDYFKIMSIVVAWSLSLHGHVLQR